jgi:AraC-like DNA-binding protein
VQFQDKFPPTVDVVARVSPLFVSQLRIALRDEHVLTVVDGWDTLAQAVRMLPVDVAIVDPRIGTSIEAAPVRELVGRYPTLPIVVYTLLTPDTLRATVELARAGIEHVVLRGFDDEPRRLRDLVERLPARRLSTIVLGALEERLTEAPPLLRAAMTRLFEAPHAFRHVDDLARAAGMTRRTLDRWLGRAGLASARMIMVSARLARAVHYMRDPGYPLDDITRKLGYENPRLFARQVRAATGLTPTKLRERAEPEQLMEELAARLCRHGGGGE